MANLKASYSASLSGGGGGKGSEAGSETDKMQNRSEQATERQRTVKVTADMSFPKSKSHQMVPTVPLHFGMLLPI